MATPTEVVLHGHTREQALERVADFMPAFDISLAVERQQAMRDFIGKILRESTEEEPGDYGTLPGTTRKVLLKPGAEKLCTFFGLSQRFIDEMIVEDWDGSAHGGEPLFYYRYKCRLYRGKRFIGEAVGSCNSRERKYRWRSTERLCPECTKPAIIKGREEYGGGWLCFHRKGGCGAKFVDTDPAIVDQTLGQVHNPDVADLVNTIQKIAQKRALVAVVLTATNASDSFTQDLEDTDPETSSAGPPAKGTANPKPAAPAAEGPRAAHSASFEEPPHRPATQAPLFDETKVPEELKVLFDRLTQKNGTTDAYQMLKDELLKVLPDIGAGEYVRILQKHGIRRGAGNSIASTKAALLEMWNLIVWAREARADYQDTHTEAA